MKKILLIKLRHHGDVLLTTPLISCCKYLFPESKIDFLTYKECKPLLEYHNDINEVFVVDRNWKKSGFIFRFNQEKKLISRIKNEKYDMVFNLTEGDRGAIYTFFSKAKIRIGVDPKGKGLFFKSSFFTHLVQLDGYIKHTVETQLDFLRVLGFNPPIEKRNLTLNYNKEILKDVLQYVKEKTIVIHGVSRWMFKALPLSLVQEIVRYLVDIGFNIILTASSEPEEIEYNKKLKNFFTGNNLIDLSGKLSLLQLAALIDKVDGIICCDSLPMHIASVYKKPLLVFFGPTSPVKWAPWRNPKSVVVQQGLSCQPCYQAGCQNKYISDCLVNLNLKNNINFLNKFLSLT